MFFLSRDGNALRYVVTVDRLRDVTMAHLHLAAAGKNGPVVAWLYPKSPPPRVRKGEISGTLSSGVLAAADLRGPLQGKSLRDLVDAVKAGDIYVQVHTEQHPEGEIRGEAAMASPAP